MRAILKRVVRPIGDSRTIVTREQGLRRWHQEWATLKAWRRDLSDVKLEVSKRSHAGRYGTCWSYEQRITIYDSQPFAGQVCTLVHELAHAATIGSAHDEPWQRVYAEAVTEITGIAVAAAAHNYHDLNVAARDAMASWWKRSGNAALWQLANGGRP